MHIRPRTYHRTDTLLCLLLSQWNLEKLSHIYKRENAYELMSDLEIASMHCDCLNKGIHQF